MAQYADTAGDLVSPAQQLADLARQLRVERAASRIVIGLSGGLCYAGLVHSLAAVPAGLFLGLAAGLATDRFRRIRPGDVAHHLDRVLPDMEESTNLLLEPPESLAPLARLQQARVAARWDPGRVKSLIPHAEIRRAIIIALPLALVGSVLLARAEWGRADVSRTVPQVMGSGAVRILEVALEIAPPGYTGARVRRVSARDAEAEEGSSVTWWAQLGGAVVAAWLKGSAGDSVPLAAVSGDRWRAETRAMSSRLFQLVAVGADGAKVESEDLRLAVKPDQPPTVTILHPGERTIQEPGAVRPVPVEVVARDDYGLDSVDISATVANGRGEAVRFRRLRLPFRSRERRDGESLLLRTVLDPSSLAMGAGDELYFNVEATDRRTPMPNRTRSATVFIIIRDTGSAPTAGLATMAMGAQPEYFRSQRQIIIDTEKLLADQPGLRVARFRERANDLGIDQALLRLRYGQFLGEEFEEKEGSAGGEAHEHDNPENATLLGQTVKDKLRVAVSAMWQAELQLRVAEPRQALPHEYRALEMIKQVQQDARVYVQRVGFEPAPIEVAKIRLTGKLEGVRDQHHVVDVTRRDSLPALRAALQLLTRPDPGAVDLGAAIEAAGRELAPLAVVDPRLLPVLRDLRKYASLIADGRSCEDCVAEIARGLWRALPPAEPAAPGAFAGRSPVRRRFERLLQESRQ